MMRYLVMIFFILSFWACASKKDSREKSRASAPSTEKRGERRPPAASVNVASGFRTLTHSLSNDAQTSKAINRQKASSIAKQLESSVRAARGENVDVRALIALMAAQRLSGQNMNAVIASARALMSEALKQNPDVDLPEVARLELVLAALASERYAMVDHFLPELLRSSNPKVRAAALTAEGMMAMRDGRLPEAVDSWRRALQADRGYEAAMLNIAFVALQYGDGKLATQMLSAMQNDWYAQMGLAAAARLAGDTRRATQLCNQALNRKGDSRMVLFNCAVNEYQSNMNFAKARTMMEKAAKMRGGPRDLEQRAYRVIQRIGQEQAKAAAEKSAPKKGAEGGAAGKQPPQRPRQKQN